MNLRNYTTKLQF